MCLFSLSIALYGSEAEYLGGTVKSIPKNMSGRLDTTDPTSLLFVFSQGVYRLPFDRIKSFETTPVRHLLLPQLPWSARAEVLDLSFRGEDQASQIISFRLTGKDAGTTISALKSRIQEPREANVLTDRSQLPEVWWGDQFWRTTRNTAPRPPSNLSQPR